MRNLFCDHSDLRNEADVEQNFARRMIEALGYSDKAIRPKAALEELTIGTVSAHAKHRPDFAMKAAGHIRWVLEAKAPRETLERHYGQANRYCKAVNDSYVTTRPIRYFVLTNGTETRLYKPGDTRPLLTLDFNDFAERNPKYLELMDLLRPGGFVVSSPVPADADTIRFTKPTISEVNSVFAKCHQFIHKSDKISQAAGFEEFVKLITLKLLSDKQIKDAYPGVTAERWFDYPSDDVEFSLRWIRKHEASTPNPVDSILFKNFMDEVETDIARRIRKRFFDKGARINLRPATIRGVVTRLERIFLFGIDADLNGRLFEDFLSATMRGKDLGQYFTPRTIVKLGVGLADLQTTDTVLDGCCGTGGFLIDALADMWAKVNRNASLSKKAKETERQYIAANCIYGIDIAKRPNLAKIARLNMYLHGDGGSRIFNVDGLDRRVKSDPTDGPEDATEKDEIRDSDLSNRFDVVLTNPPFSKEYERSNEGDSWVLDQYVIASGRSGVLAKLMFFELYYHYLRPGGRLISVIDEGFLNGKNYRWFRDMLRNWYAVKAVVSLPGDAFQRSEARVKTSFIVLEKRYADDVYFENDPAIFMYPCRYVGIDDPKRRRWMPGDDELRQKAKAEVQNVVQEYQSFMSGRGDPAYIVPATRATDRLDVKHCLTLPNWRGLDSTTVLDDVVSTKKFVADDIVVCAHHEAPVQYFTVKYGGHAEGGRTIFPRTDTEYSQLFRVRTGEIVISNIAATYGSVAVVPEHLDGLVVSKEYTVLVAKPGYNAKVVWALLRSPEIRAEMLLRTTGANRTRIDWSDIRSIAFPYPDRQTVRRFLHHVTAAEIARATAVRESEAALSKLNEAMQLDQPHAYAILDAYKPPK